MHTPWPPILFLIIEVRNQAHCIILVDLKYIIQKSKNKSVHSTTTDRGERLGSKMHHANIAVQPPSLSTSKVVRLLPHQHKPEPGPSSLHWAGQHLGLLKIALLEALLVLEQVDAVWKRLVAWWVIHEHCKSSANLREPI